MVMALALNEDDTQPEIFTTGTKEGGRRDPISNSIAVMVEQF